MKSTKRQCRKQSLRFERSKKMLAGIGTLFLVAPAHMYGQDLVPTELQSTAEQIQEIFTGDLAKIIMGCCFAGACIAYGYNKDNERMKGKMVAVVIATGLLLLTQQIMDRLWGMSS